MHFWAIKVKEHAPPLPRNWRTTAATEELLSERKQQLESMHRQMEEDLEVYEMSVGKDAEAFALQTARMRKQYELLLTRYRSEALKIQV